MAVLNCLDALCCRLRADRRERLLTVFGSFGFVDVLVTTVGSHDILVDYIEDMEVSIVCISESDYVCFGPLGRDCTVCRKQDTVVYSFNFEKDHMNIFESHRSTIPKSCYFNPFQPGRNKNVCNIVTNLYYLAQDY